MTALLGQKTFLDFFPAPEFLLLSTVGIVITDTDTRLVQLRREILGDGFKLANSSQAANPAGAVEAGLINNPDALGAVLKKLALPYGIRYAHASLPEEKTYLFTTRINWVPPEGLKDAVAFIVEENAPVSLSESVFNFEIIKEDEHADEINLAVSVVPKNVINAYVELFESVGITPISFDLESQAIARAVIHRGDKRTQLIVNLSLRKTGFYIVADEVVQFSTTPAYGIGEDESYPSLNDLKAEMRKVLAFWNARTDKSGKPEKKIEKVILVGLGGSKTEFVEKLMSESDIPYAPADVGLNMSPSRSHVSGIPFDESLSYASAIGLVLPRGRKDMFKLLTEEGGHKVAHKYAMHRAVVMLSAFIFVLVAGIIGLLPSYVLSNARQNEALERTRIMNSAGQIDNESVLQAWLKEMNRKLRILSPALDMDRPSAFIERVLDQKATGVRVTGFSWIRAKDKVTLSVNGITLDRQALITFEDRINSSGYFSEVTLPISNLAKDKDIDFQIKFSPALPTPSAQTP
ncbi:MAG: pilus assembly protein PilM [bacterium]|nr:pilus assembly protein PilM [bacterium]